MAFEIVGFCAHLLLLFERVGLCAAQRADEVFDTSLIELLLAPLDPRTALLAVEREQGTAQGPEVRCAVPRYALEMPHHLEKSASAHDLAAHNGLGSKRSME